mgnify:CR=1 FL=1
MITHNVIQYCALKHMTCCVSATAATRGTPPFVKIVSQYSMPNGLRIRAREYLRNTRDLYKKSSYNDLIKELSPDLRADIEANCSVLIFIVTIPEIPD